MFGVALNPQFPRFDANIVVIFGSYKLELLSKRGFPASQCFNKHTICVSVTRPLTHNFKIKGLKIIKVYVLRL